VDRLLQALRIKGRATPDVLAAAVEVDVASAIERCEQDGLIEQTRLGYRITDAGRERVESLYADEREQAQSVILETYATFLPINDEVKQIVTDWQMRIVGGQMVLNDHQDRGHDETVIARLHDVDSKAAPALASLAAALPRFEAYSRRLQRALASVREGDHTMLAAPIKDSYHTVWFELHEDLLLLSGNERKE
jgi:pyruvate, orthophosphate dikinase